AGSPTPFAGSDSPGTTLSLKTGGYSVTESSLAGYTQTSASADCTGTLAAGDNKTCTITNTDVAPKLTVIKHVVNNSGGRATASAFTMTVSGTAGSPTPFAGSESPGTTLSLKAGSYTVTESS